MPQLTRAVRRQPLLPWQRGLKLDDKIRGLFLNGPMENLEDFRYYFADEKEMDACAAIEEALKGQSGSSGFKNVARVGGCQAE